MLTAPPAGVIRDDWMTVVEVAQLLRICKRTVYRLLARRELARVKVGRATRIPRSSVAQYIESQLTKDAA